MSIGAAYNAFSLLKPLIKANLKKMKIQHFLTFSLKHFFVSPTLLEFQMHWLENEGGLFMCVNG